VPYFWTVDTCHARQQLDARGQAVVDRAVLWLSLVPTLGSYDGHTDSWWLAASEDLLVQYRVLSVPEPQVVIVHIGASRERQPAEGRRRLVCVQ
jgi:hypothetical protein